MELLFLNLKGYVTALVNSKCLIPSAIKETWIILILWLTFKKFTIYKNTFSLYCFLKNIL